MRLGELLTCLPVCRMACDAPGIEPDSNLTPSKRAKKFRCFLPVREGALGHSAPSSSPSWRSLLLIALAAMAFVAVVVTLLVGGGG